MTPTFVSFFTPAYAAEAAGLVETLDAHGLRHDVVGVPGFGKWTHNCAYKPSFILGMMNKWPGVPLVWLDADARIRQPPTLFDSLDCDVAFHRRHGVELLSGTVYLAPTAPARQLLERWRAECQFFPDQWDQVTLDVVLPTVPGLRVGALPGSYVRIFDGDDMGPDVVIEHRQASRRLRNAV